MSSIPSKKRFIRMLPGRIRMEFYGLLHNPEAESRLKQALAALPGVTNAEPSSRTGRLLLLYDEKRIAPAELLRQIEALERGLAAEPEPVMNEETVSGGKLPEEPAAPESPAARMEAAAASETRSGPGPVASKGLPAGDWNRPFTHRGLSASASSGRASPPAVPLPLALAMGGLVVLGGKQLLFGKSALARSPVPFYLSGLISVLTGYPFLRRGLHRFTENKKLNSDLLLGAGALGLALVRENLVVLGAISLLQYVNWRQSRLGLPSGGEEPLPANISAYSEKAGRWGIAAALGTWLFSRDPVRGIAVLLAANPRPATIPGRCAWAQAELRSKESLPALPGQLPLAGLARTDTLLLEDSALLFRHHDAAEPTCVTHDGDPDKVLCTAAALLEKTIHPWREDIWAQAKRTCRTVRTAFHVEVQEDGVSGRIHHTVYSLGNLAYCRSRGIPFESYYVEAKRMENQGYEVIYAAEETAAGKSCIGLVCRPRPALPDSQWLIEARRQGMRTLLLNDSMNAGPEAAARLGIGTDWLKLGPQEQLERIAVRHQEGSHALLVTGTPASAEGALLAEAGIPNVPFERLDNVLEARTRAKRIEATVDQHFRVTRWWNLFGSAFAAAGAISAPLANLAGDALSLLFLSRSQRQAEAAFPILSQPASLAAQEVAAALEAEVIAGNGASGGAIPWHGLPWESIADRFEADHRNGLTARQIDKLRVSFGYNELERKRSRPWLVSYLGQFKEFTTLILLGTSVLALFTGGLFDGLAMGTVLLANAAIGTIQERKAEQVVESLNHFQPPDCRVIRDGEELTLPANELVPGDIVSLEPGDRVPADIRLMRAWNLEVNEAALTGESMPVTKQESSLEIDCPLPERSNMLYMGTDVSRGKAIGVVVQTGMNTEIGHLMSLLKTESQPATPLQEKVTSISKMFIKWALAAGALVFAAGLIRGVPITQMITTSVTLAASAIPEGLPVTITIALSAGIFRMAKKNALMRKLSALETLGRTTIICTDKTGTLTKNEMTVKEIASVQGTWRVTGNGYDPEGGIYDAHSGSGQEETAGPLRVVPPQDAPAQPELHRMLQIAYLCNNSKLEQRGGVWSIQGDPTEGALLTLAAKGGYKADTMSQWHRGAEIPFDSGTGKMSVVCRDAGSGSECFIFSKGAVESILRHSSHYQQDGQLLLLTDAVKAKIAEQTERMASGALRVLGCAYRPLREDEHEQEQGLDERNMIYVGMAGMIDPPKSDVETSIREAYALGVKPVMITGDHPITAIAIARELGIDDGTRRVVSGHELESMSDAELESIIEDISIFARMNPEHKLRIVGAFQRKGHIVAMTGDGVNDTPAIKQADVGIAMGRTGTEVSKGTADMILKEDHFGSIVDGVKEGRTIIGNIRKALGCLLTGNLAEILVTSAAVIAGLPIPLVPIQILLMNLLTDALPAMVLAVSPGSKTKQTKRIDIVDKPLYKKVVVRGVLLGIGSLGLFALSLAMGEPVHVAQSIAFATLVAGQLVQTFSWRQEGTEETFRDWSKDRFLLGALGFSGLALLSTLYIPPVARLFHTAPLALRHWGPILLVAASVTFVSKPLLGLLSGRSASTQTAVPALAAA
ncbi:HAD-IC family P-type ATPase [Paenibacillus filicis]|uniref:HAD-IC family P-type ATPase n=1 Tax=Paenibacillus gyeongsangnamensis TaxID=3388067 RepID=A0ABT4QFK6_9BACL|nr:HAD-IC family P-type ATPase [Paenibacillus filicis]MCZ8515642.1 HAD-IC family P-type ATPase [Paenibacillus filicis]